jgi:hypothetical protein
MIPFSDVSIRSYSTAEWLILQRAHVQASSLLGRHPKRHQHAERLSRIIVLLFNQGSRDFQIIAALAANREFVLAKREVELAARNVPPTDEGGGSHATL